MARPKKPHGARPAPPGRGPRRLPTPRIPGFPVPQGLDRLVLREDLAQRSLDSLVAVAKLGKVWGVHGYITIRLYNSESDLAWIADAVHLRGEAFPLAWVSVTRWQDKGGKLVARFEGIDSPQDARALTHLEVLVPREDLGDLDEDEVFVHELLGMQVIDEKRGDIGQIVDVLSIGPNDVWVVRGPEHGETMVPAVEQFVRELDREARVVRVLYEEE